MKILTTVLGLCMGAVSVCAADKVSSYSHLYKDLPFEMPLIDKPVFPDNTVSITDFGAVADGETLNTEAFAKVMDVAFRYMANWSDCL